MKQTPSASAAVSTSNPSKKPKKRSGARSARAELSALLQPQLEKRIKEEWKPRHSPVVTPTTERYIDGTPIPSSWKRGARRETVDAKQFLTPLSGHPPTSADVAAAANAYKVWTDEDRQSTDAILEGFAQGTYAPFLEALEARGPRVLLDRKVNRVIEARWFDAITAYGPAQREATALLKQLGEVLASKGRGDIRTQTPEEKRASGKERKHQFDARKRAGKHVLREEKQKLKAAVNAEINRLPRNIVLNVRLFKEAREKIWTRILATAQANPSPSVGQAAHELESERKQALTIDDQ